MCDDCGCDKNAAPGEQTWRPRREAGGWHVHADGTAHCHGHYHYPHHNAHGAVFRPVAKPVRPQSDPELQDGGDGMECAAGGNPLAGKAPIR